jgi:hypothetical protein
MPAPIRRAAQLGAFAAAVVAVLLASAGHAHLAAARYTSDFYDIQARRMFHGHLTVPLDRFGLEAFVVNGHVHTYFGVLPALVRMPVLLVTSRFDGRLTQVSMALALGVLLVFSSRLSWRIRGLLRGDAAVDRLDLVCGALAPFLAVAGSVALYLVAVPIVYHEAIVWGVAASVATSTYLVEYLVAPARRTLVAIGAWVTATLLARASLGFGVVAAVGVVAIAVAARGVLRERPVGERLARLAGAAAVPATRGTVAGLFAVVVFPMVLYTGINEARFHRPLGPPYAQQVWTQMSEDRRAALAANGGSLFNVDYIPSTLVAYLRPDGASIERLFPFVEFPAERATVIGGAVFDTRDRTASIPPVMPALTVLALVGAWTVAARRRVALAAVRPVLAGGVAAVFGVLTIGFVAHRYVGDFLPLLLPLAFVGLVPTVRAVLAPRPRFGPARPAAVAAATLLVAWSVWANTGLALLVQRAYWAPDASTRHAFLAFQQRLDERLFGGGRYQQGTSAPPPDGVRGSFYVEGACDALYWNDSWVWVRIEPLADGSTPICSRLVR